MMLPTMFAALAVALGIYTWTFARARIAGLVYVGVMTLVLLAYAELMGRPKPLLLEWRDLGRVHVLAYQLDEPRAIYIWLDLGEPTGYRLPWNAQTAQQLHEAAGVAARTGGIIEGTPTQPSLSEGDPVFYSPPQLPPPPK